MSSETRAFDSATGTLVVALGRTVRDEPSARRRRFLINKPEVSLQDPLEITLVTDWAVELERLVRSEGR